MKRRLLSCICIASLVCLASAQNRVLRYDFSDVSGTTVNDASFSGINATLRGSAKVTEMGKYNVMNLGTASGYLDMGKAAGELFKTLDSYTISVYYHVDKGATITGAGNFLWAFSTSAACTASAGKYSAYRLNAQRVATSTGGYGNESGIEKGYAANLNEWEHVAFVQNGTSGKLYINGVLVGSAVMPKNTENFGTASVSYNWIGRPPFSGDSYLSSTMVYDFCLYDGALTADSVKSLAAFTDSLEYEYRYGGDGDFTALKTAVNNAKTYLNGINPADFPPSAILEFEDAINMVEYLIRENKANQTTIDEYKTALSDAKTKFVATKGKTFDTSGVVGVYDTNRGFKHPGGLHTQADFDRIKQQLADGNETVTEAYKILKNAEFSQSNCATWPVETIVRGGNSGQNYINAARGATIAYQNALRWRIEGTEANARHAVDVLMAWARTTKYISGDSNYALAAGLYGYQFAQAAELVRDYEGWSSEDFETFRKWMLDVWYPSCIGFLRGRNGTWENVGKWWQAPGHYWSNWGLCNALAVLSIGVLCDDVFIYNQGLSFIKYDQVGTFVDPRTADPILNDGLTEFWGNLIVTTSESKLETGAYGKLGQMNESGRDTGHAAMAAGLAVDVAHLAWNQGDDLFAYMDHRLAAGIEYIAAQTQSVQGLPWTNYKYGTNGYYYTDYRCWTMTGPALGAQMRNYWGTVIGHYEGIKGVKMPFSKIAYNQMGIDAGGMGSTSGGYDHLGYSVLMNTYNGLAPADKVPTEMSGKITYNGKTVDHNELGGLVNTFSSTANPGLAAGTVVTLKPQIPDTVADTGLWQWETGETTRDITVAADRSRVYRVTYTNGNGIKSEQVFTIAVQGDNGPSTIVTSVNGVNTTSADVNYGSSVVLSAYGTGGWGSLLWDNGETSSSITIPSITTSRDVSVIYINQAGTKSMATIHLNVKNVIPNIKVGETVYSNTSSKVVQTGTDVVLTPSPVGAQAGGNFVWTVNGTEVSTEQKLMVQDIEESIFPQVKYMVGDSVLATIDFSVFVHPKTDTLIEPGRYLIRLRSSGTYLTNEDTDSVVAPPSFRSFMGTQDAPSATQIWYVGRTTSARYDIMSLSDSLYLNAAGSMIKKTFKPHRITIAAGTDYVNFYNIDGKYWTVDGAGVISFGSNDELSEYPFELIPVVDYVAEDVNRDGVVDTQDVLVLYSLIISSADGDTTGDVNGDGKVDSQDVLQVYDYIRSH